MTDATAGSGRSDNGPAAAGAEQVGPTIAKAEGEASGFTCPECRGSLWETTDGDSVWFECRVDHRYSFQAVLAEQARTVEAAIWAAVNVLEERAALLRKQSLRARERGQDVVGDRFTVQADEAERHAEAIRTHLLALVQTFAPAVE